MWEGFFMFGPLVMSTYRTLLSRWYQGDIPNVFQELVTGLPANKMSQEQTAKWEMGQLLQRSPQLQQLLRTSDPESFFARLSETTEGRAFKDKYDAFLADFGQRGHADRDLYYPRRCEDPKLDYNALRILLDAGESVHPKAIEEKLIHRRLEVFDAVIADIRLRTNGWLKIRTIKWLANYAIRYLVLREDERWYLDSITLSKKWIVNEIGRRLVERGVLPDLDDHYFLTQNELFDLFDGQRPTRLTRMKIDHRRKAFQKFLRREEYPPRYIQGGVPVSIEGEQTADESGLRGTGTSPGATTGRARIVPNLAEIGRVEKGDVLVCNSTDPGWSAVFMIIKGLVMETGGMLSHGACLSREYGLPAVRLPGAMRNIPDGALVSVNGDTGEVTVIDEAERYEAREAA
jgi:pyruvate,water dikinase